MNNELALLLDNRDEAYNAYSNTWEIKEKGKYNRAMKELKNYLDTNNITGIIVDLFDDEPSIINKDSSFDYSLDVSDVDDDPYLIDGVLTGEIENYQQTNK
jgi:hypothetical protein